jgi:Cu/Ag efflux protein CusF
MTYAYSVKNDTMMNGLAPGDSVSFTIQETQPGAFRIESVRRMVTRAIK